MSPQRAKLPDTAVTCCKQSAGMGGTRGSPAFPLRTFCGPSRRCGHRLAFAGAKPDRPRSDLKRPWSMVTRAVGPEGAPSDAACQRTMIRPHPSRHVGGGPSSNIGADTGAAGRAGRASRRCRGRGQVPAASGMPEDAGSTEAGGNADVLRTCLRDLREERSRRRARIRKMPEREGPMNTGNERLDENAAQFGLKSQGRHDADTQPLGHHGQDRPLFPRLRRRRQE